MNTSDFSTSSDILVTLAVYTLAVYTFAGYSVELSG